MENVKYERREYVPPEGFVVQEGFKVRGMDDRPVPYEYAVARAREMLEEHRILKEAGYPTTYAELMECNERMSTQEIAQLQVEMQQFVASQLQLRREAV